MEKIKKMWKRFQEKIVPMPNDLMDDDCLCWTGAINESGYGRFNHNTGIKDLSTLAHRFIFQVLNPDDVTGLEVDHICKQRNCCNPSHLRLVTKSENLLYRTF